MRILHVVTSLNKSGGGTSEIVPRICLELVRAGHQVRLVAAKMSAVAESAVEAEKGGVDIRYCKAHYVPHLGFLRLTTSFRRAINEGVQWADVVHVHGHWQDVSWYAPHAARRAGKPYVMQPHGFLESERLKKSRLQKRIVAALFERRNLRLARSVIATADSERAGILLFDKSLKVDVVPLGFDCSRVDAARKSEAFMRSLGVDPGKKTLLYFSRISPIKGLDMLADAWSALAEHHDAWQLLIVGPDDRGYTQTIKAYYQERIKDGSVIFHGPIFGDDKYVLLKSADAFVLPTRSENWSIAVQEALAAGLPVVCTKGAPWGVIERDGAGFWVDISTDAIRVGLVKLMSDGADDRRVMAENGRRIIVRDFGWAAITQRLADLYGKCLESQVVRR